MSPIERIAGILSDAGHGPVDVAYFCSQLQDMIAIRTMPRLVGHRLSSCERQRAFLQLREGHSAEDVAMTMRRGGIDVNGL
jgi:hypothetical protein